MTYGKLIRPVVRFPSNLKFTEISSKIADVKLEAPRMTAGDGARRHDTINTDRRPHTTQPTFMEIH